MDIEHRDEKGTNAFGGIKREKPYKLLPYKALFWYTRKESNPQPFDP